MPQTGIRTTATCKRCEDSGWVCEEHPWSPAPHGACHAAQKPCPDCQPSDDKSRLPADWVSYASVDDVNSPDTPSEMMEPVSDVTPFIGRRQNAAPPMRQKPRRKVLQQQLHLDPAT